MRACSAPTPPRPRHPRPKCSTPAGKGGQPGLFDVRTGSWGLREGPKAQGTVQGYLTGPRPGRSRPTGWLVRDQTHREEEGLTSPCSQESPSGPPSAPGRWVGAGVQLEDGRQARRPSTTHPVCPDTRVSACRAFRSQRDCGCTGRARDTRCRGLAAGLLPPTSRSVRALSTRLGLHVVTGVTRPQETPVL